jgi:hypothetical protein
VNQKLYSIANYDLVDEWSEKWLALIELINNVTGTEQPPWSSPPPTELQEIEYQRLRFWLIDHQVQFVPLWTEFYESHDWACTPNNTDDEDGDLPQKYLEPPFLFFYEPENLYRLAQQLGLQSGIDIWEPSEHVASMVRPILIRLGQLMIEFVDWIDERVDENIAKSPRNQE